MVLAPLGAWALFTMTNWQFLIQKQGEYLWHPLESPTVELPEGRYRVVANSNYTNTDVDVRVTHYSHHESPPKRYVKTRSRRTSADGLMAVIPFTFLKPGSWELRCSGNLMSDMIGKAWRFSVRLEILPEHSHQQLVPDGDGDELISHHSGSATQQSSTHKYSQESVDSDIEQLVTSASLDENNMGDATITISAEQVAEQVIVTPNYQTIEESFNPPTNANFDTPAEIANPGVNAVDVTNLAENLPGTGNPPLDEVIVAPNNGDSKSSNEEQNPDFIDELVNPVLLKGETAEQILQNLADLALPTNEPALGSEKVDPTPPKIAELPLTITLDRENYFVSWGEAFTLDGRVEFKDVSASPRIYEGELQIELHSPQGGEAIAQTKQVVTQDTLPFSFTYELQVPEDCQSKLILADINLYGVLEKGGELILLASHGFTITAAVTELLALSAAAQSHTAEELLACSEIAIANNIKAETKVSTPPDLQLFNLVKTLPKEQTLVTQPKVTTSLPPRIDPYSLQKPTPGKSPQLPNLPFSQNQNRGVVVSDTKTTADVPQRRSRSAALPYLKKLQPLSTREKATQSEPITVKNPPATEASPTLEDENLNQVESPALHSNAELITTTENPDSVSSLIRQWIQTQGYTISQPINVQYEDYDTEQIFSHELDVDSGVVPNETPKTIDSQVAPGSNHGHESIVLQQQQSAWLGREIVVDDIIDPEVDTTSGELENTNRDIEQQQPAIPPEPLLSPQDDAKLEPIPIPELYVPPGELISGKSITIRIVLPNLGPHIAIKLWVKDCQTRRLLGAPNILKNWLAVSPHHLQLTTQLQVPFGCLQIQIEAIAIDLITQQESHKISIPCSVVPDNLPQIAINQLIEI
ncbi:hypothetical protein [Calothrix rhizosoleniae]|uniref:hypothetical protein n=1 Tax=Calothrix rhizosoleniae TaxID=888997 RepID=UPI000B49C0CB